MRSEATSACASSRLDRRRQNKDAVNSEHDQTRPQVAGGGKNLHWNNRSKEIGAGIIAQVDTDVSVSFPDERNPRSNDDSPDARKKSAAASAMRLPERKLASIPSLLNRSKPFAFDGRTDNFPWHDQE